MTFNNKNDRSSDEWSSFSQKKSDEKLWLIFCYELGNPKCEWFDFK